MAVNTYALERLVGECNTSHRCYYTLPNAIRGCTTAYKYELLSQIINIHLYTNL